jgi:truncated hemoglobin YjbI
MGMQELEIYSMIGAEGFARLVAAIYRQVPQDDLLGPIYPASDLPGAEQRSRSRNAVANASTTSSSRESKCL